MQPIYSTKTPQFLSLSSEHIEALINSWYEFKHALAVPSTHLHWHPVTGSHVQCCIPLRWTVLCVGEISNSDTSTSRNQFVHSLCFTADLDVSWRYISMGGRVSLIGSKSHPKLWGESKFSVSSFGINLLH
jgi:hypothetical protein